ncbi:energy transducer TonB [Piscinibacter sp.]|jgi:protein TonB|uniref:energy transducer TonB n=1 Tax=Piscinibacter sp. TaxID=1903157 RepID=UPI002F41C896
MNYAQHQRAPIRHLVGFGVVAAMHLLLGWALVTGLARKVVDVIVAPVETKIIEEHRPPPPPEEPPPPPLAFAPPPPPAYVPPPEVRIAVPPPIAPTITAITTAPPPAPVAITPVLPAQPASVSAPVARLAPPAPSRTAPSLNFNQCEKPTYNAAATRAGVMGTVVVSYVMDTDGRISETRIERSAGPSSEHRILDRLTLDAITRCRGKPGTVDGKPEKLRGSVEYVWKLE